MSQRTTIDPFPAGHSNEATHDVAPARLPASRSGTGTVSNSLTMPVAAGPYETCRALQRLDLVASAIRVLHAMGLGDHVELRPGGFTWLPDNADGHVDVDIDVRVQPVFEGSSFLSIRTRFSASDDDTRTRLLDAWAVVGPLADQVTRRAARTVKDYAEEDRFEDDRVYTGACGRSAARAAGGTKRVRQGHLSRPTSSHP